jgi:DoxX-like family
MKLIKQHVMKNYKIIFWVSTALIFLMEGVMPALTSHTDLSVNGITHLGYPVYFVTMLTVFKVAGALSLILPQVPSRIKEWAYAGFGIDFIAAFVSIFVVDGLVPALIVPLVFMGILVLSYVSRQKMLATLK